MATWKRLQEGSVWGSHTNQEALQRLLWSTLMATTPTPSPSFPNVIQVSIFSISGHMLQDLTGLNLLGS